MLPTSIAFSSEGLPLLTGAAGNTLVLFCQPVFMPLQQPGQHIFAGIQVQPDQALAQAVWRRAVRRYGDYMQIMWIQRHLPYFDTKYFQLRDGILLEAFHQG